MNTDAELLRLHVEDRSKDAFTELVQRHIGLVYSCALRGVGNDAHLAEDVTQKVFCDLARKASSLLTRPSLTGWLYVGTHHAAAAAVRQERRRKIREEQAFTMENILHPAPSGPEPDWSRLRPLLDELIMELSEVDRDTVILRFFEKRPFAEIAAALQLSEEAARKRTDRAIEKLRARLAERGVTSGTGALAFALAGQAAAAVPATLATSVTGSALAAAGAASPLFAALAGMLLSDAAAVVATVLAAAGLIGWQHHAASALQAELTAQENEDREIRTLQQSNLQLARRAAETEALQRMLAEPAVPRAATVVSSSPQPAAAVNLTVTTQGTLRWENQPVALADFINRLAVLQQQHPDQTAQIVIHGSAGVEFGPVSYAVEQASRAGIKNIVIDSQARPDPANNWITPGATVPGPNDRLPPSLPDPAVHP
jgi:RNA polymerase sigma factor (sigma-70 family)